MIPLNVKMRGYRSFDAAEVDLQGLGGAVIAGENGAGKSTLIEAILWCLYGESRSGSRAHDRVVRIGCQEASVTVEFEAAGEQYKVTRTRSTKGRGKSTLEFYRLDGRDLAGAGAWTPLTGKNATGEEEDGATQAAIQKALGISYETLVSGPIILQDDADRFTRAKPEERRETLRQILRLDEYKTLAGRARGKANEATTQADVRRRDLDAEGNPEDELEMARDGLEHRRTARTEADAAVTSAEREHETAQEAAREAKGKKEAQVAQLARRPALQDALADAAQSTSAVRTEVARLEAVVREAPTVREAAEKVPTLETEEAALVEAIAEAGAAQEKRTNMEARRAELLTRYQDTKKKRDAARTEADGVERAELLAGMVESRTQILADVQGDLEKAREQQTETREQQAQTLKNAGDLDAHPEVQEAKTAAERAAAAAEVKAEEANAANTNLLRANAKVIAAHNALHYRRGDVTRLEQEIGTLTKRTGLLAEVPCTRSASGYLPHEATTPQELITKVDLAGTCPLLADARGAAATLAEKRSALAEAQVDVTRLEEAATEAEKFERAALEVKNEATTAARTAKDEATTAAAHAAGVRALIRGHQQETAAHAAEAVRRADRAVDEAQRALTEAQETLAASKAAQATLESKKAAQARAAEEQQALDGITAEGERVRDEIAALPQAANPEVLKGILTEHRGKLAAARTLTGKLAQVEHAEAEVEVARRRLARATEAEQQAQQALDECRENPALAQAAEEATRAAAEAAARLAAARDAATRAAQAVTRSEAEVERLEAAVAARAKKRTEVERLAAEAAGWTQTAQALEIAAVILIERAIPIIEAHANKTLQRISSRGMRLTLNTQRQNKTTEGVRETLDVIVQDAVGVRPYEDFSGGEKFRINMALRLGLAKLLADREGVPVEFLAVDEGGFGALDPDGIGAMKDVMATLQQDFRLVLLITHIPDVADCLPRMLRIRQNGAGSVIEVAA